MAGKLAPLSRLWMGFASVVSRITTPVFRGVVYFLVFTLAGLLIEMERQFSVGV